jgi:TonB family protein
MLGVYGYMRPLLYITALLSFSVLCIDTNLAAQQATIAEPPFVSDHKRPVKVVKPVYPAAALKAGVEGVVNLEVFVSKDGRVENAKAMNGPTPLRQAAIDALKQWEWEPFLLNSSAIRVRTRVTLRFDLHNKSASQE